MNVSRRKFLGAAPIVAGVLLQLNNGALGQSPERIGPPVFTGDSLAMLSWDSFYQFINTEFTFGVGYNAVSLKLVDMTDSRPVRTKRKSGIQENFVMKFQGPRNRVLSQGTYKVNHFNLGDFDLFITDGGRARREQYYVAVINRIVQ